MNVKFSLKHPTLVCNHKHQHHIVECWVTALISKDDKGKHFNKFHHITQTSRPPSPPLRKNSMASNICWYVLPQKKYYLVLYLIDMSHVVGCYGLLHLLTECVYFLGPFGDQIMSAKILAPMSNNFNKYRIPNISLPKLILSHQNFLKALCEAVKC